MNKFYIDHIDIMNCFNCGRDKARGIIRAIKQTSDIAGISGKVTTTDFEKWFNAPIKKDSVDSRPGTV